ncbi:MAG TPA: hypothetical protein VG122_08995 [Gemmata sp.]|nr:hypothetical protein [Gemmata sp.]
MTSPWLSGVASLRVVIHVNAEQAPKVPNVGADPLRQWGRPPTLARRSPGPRATRPSIPTGVYGDDTQTNGDCRNTGSPKWWEDTLPTGRPRGTGRAIWGGGQVRSTEEAG